MKMTTTMSHKILFFKGLYAKLFKLVHTWNKFQYEIIFG